MRAYARRSIVVMGKYPREFVAVNSGDEFALNPVIAPKKRQLRVGQSHVTWNIDSTRIHDLINRLIKVLLHRCPISRTADIAKF